MFFFNIQLNIALIDLHIFCLKFIDEDYIANSIKSISLWCGSRQILSSIPGPGSTDLETGQAVTEKTSLDMESRTETDSFSSKHLDTDLYQQTPQMYSMQNIAVDTRIRTLVQPWILILQIFFFSSLLFTLIKSTKQQLKTPRCDICRNLRKVSAEKM